MATPKITLAKLKDLAGEMNTVMGLDPEIDVEEYDDKKELQDRVVEETKDENDECQIYESDYLAGKTEDKDAEPKFSKNAWAMLKALDVEPVEEEPEPPSESEKKTPPKKKTAAEKKTAPKKKETPKKKTPEKKDKKPAAEKKDKKPGVIATIKKTIQDKGPVTKAAILKVLVKKFPDRKEESMAKTVNVQVPNRINKEEKYTLESTEKGAWFVKGSKK